MRGQRSFPVCLLLLWALTGSVSCADNKIPEIKVKTKSDGIVLSCAEGKMKKSDNDSLTDTMTLTYSDTNTGTYTCVSDTERDTESSIFVKFRTCDNCIELDTSAIVGITVGNMMATVAIGVAVYLIASQNRIDTGTSHKKSSDRQHLVPNEVTNRAPNDHYQPLKHKGGQKDTYDVLTNKR